MDENILQYLRNINNRIKHWVKKVLVPLLALGTKRMLCFSLISTQKSSQDEQLDCKEPRPNNNKSKDSSVSNEMGTLVQDTRSPGLLN